MTNPVSSEESFNFPCLAQVRKSFVIVFYKQTQSPLFQKRIIVLFVFWLRNHFLRSKMCRQMKQKYEAQEKSIEKKNDRNFGNVVNKVLMTITVSLKRQRFRWANKRDDKYSQFNHVHCLLGFEQLS